MSRVRARPCGTPISALPPERSIRQAAPTILPGCCGERGEAFARRRPVVMMSSTISTRAPGANVEAAPQLEHAVLALDENRLRAEPARRLVARHDAAERRRGDDVDLAECLARHRGQRPAELFRARRVLEDEHLLQEHRRAQARGQNEMALEQRAGGAELFEVCSGVSRLEFRHAQVLAGEGAKAKAGERSKCPHSLNAELPEITATAVAPDGTAVRLLTALGGGSFAHFELPAGAVSHAVAHRTVEEIWYFVGGHGQIWRKLGDEETVVDVEPGLSLTIPLGTAFQFRAAPGEPLAFVAVTMPPWPGDGEAYRVEGPWSATVG